MQHPHEGKRRCCGARRRWLSIIFSFLMLHSTAALAASKPNVLCIMVDDLNTRIGCYGHPMVKTPNMDALAKRGVVFEYAYCQAPLCAPSRTSMLTGLRQGKTNCYWNKDNFRKTRSKTVALPQHFRKNGYFASRVGKAYHQSVPKDIGRSGRMDDPKSWDRVVNPKGAEVGKKYEKAGTFGLGPWNGTSDGRDMTDAKVADETIKLLREHAGKGRAFFQVAGFYLPHTPMLAPKKYFNQYPVSSIVLPTYPPGDRDDMPEGETYISVRDGLVALPAGEKKKILQAYFAATSFVDVQIGRVLDALDELKLRNNTIVVLWGDNGWHLAEHGLFHKNTLLEESVRSPLIIAAPGMPRGAKTKRIVEALDIYPTLCELAGLKTPRELDGVSLAPLMQHPDRPWADAAFCISKVRNDPAKMGYLIRTERWAFMEWAKGKGGIELYDMRNDSRQFTNLAEDRAYADTVRKLKSRLYAQTKSIPSWTPPKRQAAISVPAPQLTKHIRSGARKWYDINGSRREATGQGSPAAFFSYQRARGVVAGRVE